MFPVCEGVWCAGCYDVDLEDDVFPIKRLVSPEDKHAVVDDKDTERLLVARDGDHFMCMFQCDLCHFRNIQHRLPRAGLMKDQLLLRCIPGANLDAMWARQPTTVANNTRQVRKLVEKGKELGYAMDCYWCQLVRSR